MTWLFRPWPVWVYAFALGFMLAGWLAILLWTFA